MSLIKSIRTRLSTVSNKSLRQVAEKCLQWATLSTSRSYTTLDNYQFITYVGFSHVYFRHQKLIPDANGKNNQHQKMESIYGAGFCTDIRHLSEEKKTRNSLPKDVDFSSLL